MFEISKRKTHKLTFEQKCEIWKLYNDGFSPSEVAKKYNVSSITIYRIGNDDRYKN